MAQKPDMIGSLAVETAVKHLNGETVEKSVPVPLELVDLLILNEVEGQALTGEHAPEAMAKKLLTRNPNGAVVVTLGELGSYYRGQEGEYRQSAHAAQAVDTTAAGDTFTGYFIAGIQENLGVAGSLDLASRAAALCVSKAGAADSIPFRQELK